MLPAGSATKPVRPPRPSTMPAASFTPPVARRCGTCLARGRTYARAWRCSPSWCTAPGGGAVADIGCGPGYVTGHLHELGVDTFGIDLSPEMMTIGRRDYPDLQFDVGTMTDVDLEDNSAAGVVAFWSVIHVPDHAIPGVFEEFRRVVRSGGPVLIGFHVGDEARHTSEGYTGRTIALDSCRRRPSKLAGWLRDAGITIEGELVVIGPDEDVPGAIIFARSQS